MKGLELRAIKDLKAFYSLYLVDGIDDFLKSMAVQIEGRYIGASALLSDTVVQAVGRLVDFYTKTKSPPTKEQAEKILEGLEAREKELLRC